MSEGALERIFYCEPSAQAADGFNVVVSARDDRKTEQIRVLVAKPSPALYQDDCDFMTGQILLLLIISQTEDEYNSNTRHCLSGRKQTDVTLVPV